MRVNVGDQVVFTRKYKKLVGNIERVAKGESESWGEVYEISWEGFLGFARREWFHSMDIMGLITDGDNARERT